MEQLIELLKQLCGISELTGYDIDRSYTPETLKQINISIYYDLPFDPVKKPEFFSFSSEQSAIEGIQALINLKKAEALTQ